MKRNQENVENEINEKFDEYSEQLKRIKITIQDATNNLIENHENIVKDKETIERNIDKLLNEDKELKEKLNQVQEETIKMIQEQEDLQYRVEEIDQRIAESYDLEQNVKIDIKKLSALLGYEISDHESAKAEEMPLNHRFIRVTYNDSKSLVISVKDDTANDVISSTSAEVSTTKEECTSNNDHIPTTQSSSEVRIFRNNSLIKKSYKNIVAPKIQNELTRMEQPSTTHNINESELITSTTDDPKEDSRTPSSTSIIEHGYVDEISQEEQFTDGQREGPGNESIYDLIEITPSHQNFQQIREYLHATQDVSGLLNCLQYY